MASAVSIRLGWVVRRATPDPPFRKTGVFQRELVPVSLESAVRGAERRCERHVLLDEQLDQILGLCLVHLRVKVRFVARIVLARHRHACHRAPDAGGVGQIARAHHRRFARTEHRTVRAHERRLAEPPCLVRPGLVDLHRQAAFGELNHVGAQLYPGANELARLLSASSVSGLGVPGVSRPVPPTGSVVNLDSPVKGRGPRTSPLCTPSR